MKDLDDYFKKHLDNINPPFDESAEMAWERLLPRLPQQKRPFLFPTFLPKISTKNAFIALSLGTLTLGGVFLFLQKSLQNNISEKDILQNQFLGKNKTLDVNSFQKLNQKQNLDKTLQANSEKLQTENRKNNVEINNQKLNNAQLNNSTQNQNFASIGLGNQENTNQPLANTKNQNKENVKIFVLKNENTKGKQDIQKLEIQKTETRQNTSDNLEILPKVKSENIKSENKDNQQGNNQQEKIGRLQKFENYNFSTLKAISITEIQFTETQSEEQISLPFENTTEKKSKFMLATPRTLVLDSNLLENANKISIKNGFYITQSQIIAPFVEATNRNWGVGLANEIIFNHKYSIFTTLGISQQKYQYQSSEANNFVLAKGFNDLNGFKTHVTQNSLNMTIEGRIYPDFMHGKGFFGLGTPVQVILQENRRDEGLEYWVLAQNSQKSRIFNAFTHINLSMGASVPLNSRTELQISPVFQIPLYKIYKEDISGYIFGVKGIVLLR